jgi:DNA-directed RNA polymerase specialized sigma24 family protein
VVLSEELPNLSAEVFNAWRWLQDNPNESTKPEGSLAKPARQVQRRLKPAEEEAAVAAYLSGLTVYEVGAKFSIHRTTVSAILKRKQIKMRRAPKRSYRLQADVSNAGSAAPG